MKKQILVDLFGDEGNFAVVKLPGRAMHAIVFQLDSLERVVSDLKEAIRLLREGKADGALDELSIISSELESVCLYAKVEGEKG